MDFIPLTWIVRFPLNIQFLYFASSLLIAVAGTNRKMGFWGYLFCSITLSPVIGLMMVLVSDKKKTENEIKKLENGS
ncbi:hypothetical protein QUF72_08300 [Desulfobacterales bacterium HSG2]|nr:hypothetical protein [Desulfobacterales bacterium HSG2]